MNMFVRYSNAESVYSECEIRCKNQRPPPTGEQIYVKGALYLQKCDTLLLIPISLTWSSYA